MNSKEKDSLIKELKDQIRNLREKISSSNPQELTDLPEEGFGFFIKDKKYYLAELAFNSNDMTAKVTSVKEVDKNPRSYSILRLRANEHLNGKILPKISVITS